MRLRSAFAAVLALCAPQAAFAFLLVLLAPQAALAWNNHGLVAWWAFKEVPEVANAPQATVEPLEAFLRDQEPAIAALLDQQETWARANVPHYPPRPDELAFRADPARDDAARRRAFTNALRIAENTKFALFQQPAPAVTPDASRLLPNSAVSTLRDPAFSFHRRYRLDPGEKVSALTVLATASDEPDLGTDINCWDDSPSDWGKRYRFGKLPFGNPNLDFSTQAPFHMGFYHQSAIVYRAASFVSRTYPRLRVRQFMELAQLAFRTGHDYWGWRFAGNALHYVQDLTQPYHSSLLPGVSTARMLWVNTVAMLGWPRMKDDMIILVSNRHLALERYQAQLVHQATSGAGAALVLDALQARSRDASYPAWSDSYIVDVVTSEAYDLGEKLNAALLSAVPAAYVSDPKYDFGSQAVGVDLYAELARKPAAERADLDGLVAELLGHFGAHSRKLMGAILAGATVATK